MVDDELPNIFDTPIQIKPIIDGDGAPHPKPSNLFLFSPIFKIYFMLTFK